MREYCVCFMDTTTGYWDECFVWARNLMDAIKDASSQAPKHYKFDKAFPIQWA